jgi:transcription elongation factor SPT4
MPPKGGNKKADLRACLICSYLQSSSDFLNSGCPNCEDILNVRFDLQCKAHPAQRPLYERLRELCLITDARRSKQSCRVHQHHVGRDDSDDQPGGELGRAMATDRWVAGNLVTGECLISDKRSRGIYAVRVTGRPPSDVIEAIEARGGVYRPRDAVED